MYDFHYTLLIPPSNMSLDVGMGGEAMRTLIAGVVETSLRSQMTAEPMSREFVHQHKLPTVVAGAFLAAVNWQRERLSIGLGLWKVGAASKVLA
jgi:hypothetical protein